MLYTVSVAHYSSTCSLKFRHRSTDGSERFNMQCHALYKSLYNIMLYTVSVAHYSSYLLIKFRHRSTDGSERFNMQCHAIYKSLYNIMFYTVSVAHYSSYLLTKIPAPLISKNERQRYNNKRAAVSSDRSSQFAIVSESCYSLTKQTSRFASVLECSSVFSTSIVKADHEGFSDCTRCRRCRRSRHSRCW
jgi:hypothetical protein